MNVTDPLDDENRNIHYSLIIRCWRDSQGKLRGNLMDPITNQSFPFSSLAGLHKVLDHAMRKFSIVQENGEQGGETIK